MKEITEKINSAQVSRPDPDVESTVRFLSSNFLRSSIQSVDFVGTVCTVAWICGSLPRSGASHHGATHHFWNNKLSIISGSFLPIKTSNGRITSSASQERARSMFTSSVRTGSVQTVCLVNVRYTGSKQISEHFFGRSTRKLERWAQAVHSSERELAGVLHHHGVLLKSSCDPNHRSSMYINQKGMLKCASRNRRHQALLRCIMHKSLRWNQTLGRGAKLGVMENFSSERIFQFMLYVITLVISCRSSSRTRTLEVNVEDWIWRDFSMCVKKSCCWPNFHVATDIWLRRRLSEWHMRL